MILVEVKVPSMDKSYDFMLDESMPIAAVIEEIVEMVSQKEQCQIVGNKEEVLLCQYSGEIVLNRQWTLEDYQITHGGKLLLV